ncbi:MAG: hypothetical protein HFACDABA_02790 [Anaerolineales bacterium]|nr:hypothetical protein [Anaerolineales bacterium]
MTRTEQSKGFIELEWVCPSCNSRNRGPVKACENCGAAQPEDVKFYAPAEAKLIQDENAKKIAGAGPDIHCPFCGTRNRGDAAVCAQCGGDLKEGRKREAGREMQRQSPVIEVQCTNCGEVNPSTRRICAQCGAPLPRAGTPPDAPLRPATASAAVPSEAKRGLPWLWVGGVVACLVILCVGAAMLFSPSQTVEASVQDVYWQSATPLQEEQAVRYVNEAGSAPGGAYEVSCQTETRQVCVDKTIDRGNGYAEVVTECHDESQQYCSYTLDEWKTIDTLTMDGHDFEPFYASPDLSFGQRLGNVTITFTVYFYADGKTYTYSPADLDEFQQFDLGSAWTLHLNAFDTVVSVSR